MKNIITHTFLRKKHVLLCCEKMKLKGNWDLSKVWFSFSFSFFPILRKFDTSNVRFHLFYRNFHHPLQGRLSLLISKSVLHNFAEKYTKISVFSDYADTLMTYINFPVHDHIRLYHIQFIKETVFCNSYQFCTDATMVSKKFKEEVKTNNFQ